MKKKPISLIMALKTIQQLGKILTKEVKDVYIENYKTLMKEVEKTQKRR